MTEAQWLTSEDPAVMLAVVTAHVSSTGHHSPFGSTGLRPVSDRKLRLFGCSLLRTDDPSAEPLVRAVEAFVEGQADVYHLRSVWRALRLPDAAGTVEPEAAGRWAIGLCESKPHPIAPALLREIVGNPFRIDKDQYWPYHKRQQYCTLTVLSLAQAAYEERLDDGTLEPFRLAVLADALEEAGCDDLSLLGHLRGLWSCWGAGALAERQKPITHVRGCWAIDLILGKS